MKTSTTSVLVLAAASTLAIADGGDYGLWVANGKVQTAIGDHAEGDLENLGERVFAADLEAVLGGWEAEEPGIFIPEALLPDNTAVGFRILSNLRYWDGNGAVSIGDAVDTMTLQFGPESRTTPNAVSIVDGFTINYDADAVGGFDEHFDFLLGDGAPTGVYFLEMSFTLSGFADSRSTWTVFNAGLSEEIHDQAVDYAANVLVPAPGSAAIGVLTLGMLSARRRRG